MSMFSYLTNARVIGLVTVAMYDKYHVTTRLTYIIMTRINMTFIIFHQDFLWHGSANRKVVCLNHIVRVYLSNFVFNVFSCFAIFTARRSPC